MPKFTTKTDPPLDVEWVQGTQGKPHVVTITGENRKLLYEGDSMADAKEVYDNVVAHYGEREKARADNPSRPDEAERAVQFKPIRKRGAPSQSR